MNQYWSTPDQKCFRFKKGFGGGREGKKLGGKVRRSPSHQSREKNGERPFERTQSEHLQSIRMCIYIWWVIRMVRINFSSIFTVYIVYMCTCLHVNVYMYKHILLHTYTFKSICLYMYTCTCTHVHVYTYIHVKPFRTLYSHETIFRNVFLFKYGENTTILKYYYSNQLRFIYTTLTPSLLIWFLINPSVIISASAVYFDPHFFAECSFFYLWWEDVRVLFKNRILESFVSAWSHRPLL